MSELNFLLVQTDMRIFLTKEQLRLGIQFPGDCMDNAHKFADKLKGKNEVFYLDGV